MSEIIVSIPAKIAVDIQGFVSDEETRYYLNGFAVQSSIDGGVRVIATDGHVLGLFKVHGGFVGENVIVKLSKDTIRTCTNAIKKYKKHSRIVWLTVDSDGLATIGHDKNSQAPTTAFATDSEHFIALQPNALIDGTFPDWTRVIPTIPEKPVTGCWFNHTYLARFGKIGGKNSQIRVVETGLRDPALVSVEGYDNFIGVIMPMKGESFAGVPSWVAPDGARGDEQQAEAA